MSESAQPPALHPAVKTANRYLIAVCASSSVTLLLVALVFPDQLIMLPALAFAAVAAIEVLRYGIVPDETTRRGILQDGLGDAVSTIILGYGLWCLANLAVLPVAEIPDFLTYIIGISLSILAALSFVFGFFGVVHTIYKVCKHKPAPPKATLVA